MARFGRRHIYVSRQTLPALGFILLGLIMMVTPFIAAHTGYIGEVMVARDRLRPPFDKTLVLIGQEGLDGTIGIILNKPLTPDQHSRLSSFLRDSGVPVGYGGPLGVGDKIFVLEETGPGMPDGVPAYSLSPWDDAAHDTPDLLEKIQKSIKKGEQRYRLFTGFAAWGPFQLEGETLLKDLWYSVNATHDVVFQNGPAAQWDALEQKKKASETAPKNQS